MDCQGRSVKGLVEVDSEPLKGDVASWCTIHRKNPKAWQLMLTRTSSEGMNKNIHVNSCQLILVDHAKGIAQEWHCSNRNWISGISWSSWCAFAHHLSRSRANCNFLGNWPIYARPVIENVSHVFVVFYVTPLDGSSVFVFCCLTPFRMMGGFFFLCWFCLFAPLFVQCRMHIIIPYMKCSEHEKREIL